MSNRLLRLRERLTTENLDAVLVTAASNRRYLSGFTGSAGSLVVSQQRALLSTDFRYWEQVGQQSKDFELIKLTQGGLKSWLPPLLKEMGCRTLGFESDEVSYSTFEALKAAIETLPSEDRPALKPVSGLVEGIRIIKDPEELALITRAVQISDRAFETVAARLEPGMNEVQIAWEIEKSIREQGAESTSFDLIVAAGPNAALPHHHPDKTELKMGEPCVIDIGARYEGYCSDLTRTIVLGKPDAQFRKIYDIVLAAQETAINAVKAGMTGHECDKLARDIIEKAGYGEQFGHGVGHGVGLDIHENPRVSRNANNELTDGMVFTIEPGIYIPGWGGVRIEDIVSMEHGRARLVSKAHKRDAIPV